MQRGNSKRENQDAFLRRAKEVLADPYLVAAIGWFAAINSKGGRAHKFSVDPKFEIREDEGGECQNIV